MRFGPSTQLPSIRLIDVVEENVCPTAVANGVYLLVLHLLRALSRSCGGPSACLGGSFARAACWASERLKELHDFDLYVLGGPLWLERALEILTEAAPMYAFRLGEVSRVNSPKTGPYAGVSVKVKLLHPVGSKETCRLPDISFMLVNEGFSLATTVGTSYTTHAGAFVYYSDASDTLVGALTLTTQLAMREPGALAHMPPLRVLSFFEDPTHATYVAAVAAEAASFEAAAVAASVAPAAAAAAAAASGGGAPPAPPLLDAAYLDSPEGEAALHDALVVHASLSAIGQMIEPNKHWVVDVPGLTRVKGTSAVAFKLRIAAVFQALRWIVAHHPPAPAPLPRHRGEGKEEYKARNAAHAAAERRRFARAGPRITDAALENAARALVRDTGRIERDARGGVQFDMRGTAALFVRDVRRGGTAVFSHRQLRAAERVSTFDPRSFPPPNRVKEASPSAIGGGIYNHLVGLPRLKLHAMDKAEHELYTELFGSHDAVRDRSGEKVAKGRDADKSKKEDEHTRRMMTWAYPNLRAELSRRMLWGRSSPIHVLVTVALHGYKGPVSDRPARLESKILGAAEACGDEHVAFVLKSWARCRAVALHRHQDILERAEACLAAALEPVLQRKIVFLHSEDEVLRWCRLLRDWTAGVARPLVFVSFGRSCIFMQLTVPKNPSKTAAFGRSISSVQMEDIRGQAVAKKAVDKVARETQMADSNEKLKIAFLAVVGARADLHPGMAAGDDDVDGDAASAGGGGGGGAGGSRARALTRGGGGGGGASPAARASPPREPSAKAAPSPAASASAAGRRGSRAGGAAGSAAGGAGDGSAPAASSALASTSSAATAAAAPRYTMETRPAKTPPLTQQRIQNALLWIAAFAPPSIVQRVLAAQDEVPLVQHDRPTHVLAAAGLQKGTDAYLEYVLPHAEAAVAPPPSSSSSSSSSSASASPKGAYAKAPGASAKAPPSKARAGGGAAAASAGGGDSGAAPAPAAAHEHTPAAEKLGRISVRRLPNLFAILRGNYRTKVAVQGEVLEHVRGVSAATDIGAHIRNFALTAACEARLAAGPAPLLAPPSAAAASSSSSSAAAAAAAAAALGPAPPPPPFPFFPDMNLAHTARKGNPPVAFVHSLQIGRKPSKAGMIPTWEPAIAQAWSAIHRGIGPIMHRAADDFWAARTIGDKLALDSAGRADWSAFARSAGFSNVHGVHVRLLDLYEYEFSLLARTQALLAFAAGHQAEAANWLLLQHGALGRNVQLHYNRLAIGLTHVVPAKPAGAPAKRFRPTLSPKAALAAGQVLRGAEHGGRTFAEHCAAVALADGRVLYGQGWRVDEHFDRVDFFKAAALKVTSEVYIAALPNGKERARTSKAAKAVLACIKGSSAVKATAKVKGRKATPPDQGTIALLRRAINLRPLDTIMLSHVVNVRHSAIAAAAGAAAVDRSWMGFSAPRSWAAGGGGGAAGAAAAAPGDVGALAATLAGAGFEVDGDRDEEAPDEFPEEEEQDDGVHGADDDEDDDEDGEAGGGGGGGHDGADAGDDDEGSALLGLDDVSKGIRRVERYPFKLLGIAPLHNLQAHHVNILPSTLTSSPAFPSLKSRLGLAHRTLHDLLDVTAVLGPNEVLSSISVDENGQVAIRCRQRLPRLCHACGQKAGIKAVQCGTLSDACSAHWFHKCCLGVGGDTGCDSASCLACRTRAAAPPPLAEAAAASAAAAEVSPSSASATSSSSAAPPAASFSPAPSAPARRALAASAALRPSAAASSSSSSSSSSSAARSASASASAPPLAPSHPSTYKYELAQWAQRSALAAADRLAGCDPGIHTEATVGSFERDLRDPARRFVVRIDRLSRKQRHEEEKMGRRMRADVERFARSEALTNLDRALRLPGGGSLTARSSSTASILAFLAVFLPRIEGAQRAFAEDSGWSSSRFGAISSRQRVMGGFFGRIFAGRVQGGTAGVRLGLGIGLAKFAAPGCAAKQLRPAAAAAAGGVHHAGNACCAADVPEPYTTQWHNVCGDRMQVVYQSHDGVTFERLHSPWRCANPSCPLYGRYISRDPGSSLAIYDRTRSVAYGERVPWPQASRKGEGLPKDFNSPSVPAHVLAVPSRPSMGLGRRHSSAQP